MRDNSNDPGLDCRRLELEVHAQSVHELGERDGQFAEYEAYLCDYYELKLLIYVPHTTHERINTKCMEELTGLGLIRTHTSRCSVLVLAE